MSLLKLKFPEKVLDTEFGKIPVRGVNAEDLMLLLVEYRHPIEAVFKAGTDDTMSDDDKFAAMSTAFMSFPELVNKAIAMVTGEGTPDECKVAAKIPFPLQLEIIQAAVDMTFQGYGLKKAMTLLTQMLVGIQQGIQELQAPASGLD